MNQKPIVAPPELVLPDYTIHAYPLHNMYKVVHFRSTAPRFVSTADRAKKGNDHKLDPAISRAKKVVLELALCNPWDYFCTFTLSSGKHDRFDLDEWHRGFTQWLRDERKKGYDIRFVLVPERHKDGAWHAHGLFKGNVDLVSFADLRRAGHRVPDKLVNGGYLNWTAYQKKFGFCSFGRIRDPVACGFYTTKYLNKEIGQHVSNVGKHLYWASRPLERSVKHGDIYGHCSYLDGFLTNRYDFCDTGMTHVKDNLDWTFAMEYMLLEPLEFSDPVDHAPENEVDTYMDAVQMVLDGFTDSSVP